jgi:hypothetical protein
LTIDGSHRANAGMERLLNAYVGVKVDYKRVDLSGLDNPLTGGAVVGTSQLIDNVFSAGINIHFNGGPVVAKY